MPDEPTPLLSLCLATCNRARYLDRYLTHHLTALDASGIDYELVVSDNASTDETPAILAAFAARHPRMRVSRQARNVGAYPNILTVLHQARGEVLVHIADDDLAVTDQLLAYARRLADDPALVMIQAPWRLVDETRDGAVIGKFYDFPGERRFGQADYGPCLAFVLQYSVFPECWLIRRSVLASVVGTVPRFAYSFFLMLARALAKGEVLFAPEPHLMATAVSKGGGQAGNAEAMEAWDSYRGGIEMLSSFARQSNPEAMADPAVLGRAIQAFVNDRIAVATRLHAHAGNWACAYQLLRRLHAYDLTPPIGADPNDVAIMAAIETMIVECAQRGATEVVVGEGVPDNVLERMSPIDGVRVIRAGAVSPGDVRRAYCAVGPATDPSLRDQDFAFDIITAVERFPLFPA